MTAYFDNMDKAISVADAKARATWPDIDEHMGEAVKPLIEIEEQMVWDVTIAVEVPFFLGGDDTAEARGRLRTQVHETILKHAVHCRPVFDLTHPTVDDWDSHVREITRLSSELHTLFHGLSHTGLSDNPLSALRQLYDSGDEKRDGMAMRTLVRSLVGKSNDDASAELTRRGLENRVTKRDGVPGVVTRDYHPLRVNLVLEGGLVVKAYTDDHKSSSD